MKEIQIPDKFYYAYNLLGEDYIEEFDVIDYQISYTIKRNKSTWKGITKDNCRLHGFYFTEEEAEEALKEERENGNLSSM